MAEARDGFHAQSKFQEQVVSRRKDEFESRKKERDERVAQLKQKRSQERLVKRKMEYYRRQEEIRIVKLREEEAARKKQGLYITDC
mgnify:FL=1